MNLSLPYKPQLVIGIFSKSYNNTFHKFILLYFIFNKTSRNMEKEEKEDANGTENSGTLAASNSSSSVSPGNFDSMLERVNITVKKYG